MKPLTIIRHIECEGPGHLGTVLEQSQIDYQLVAIDRHDPLPDSVNDSSGLVIMGGPMSVNDDDEWIRQETRLIQQAIDNDLPVLGHCLGGQFIAKALNANIKRNPVKEIGWLPVHASADGEGLPAWLESFQSPQTVFHWHGETFELPAGASKLLSSEHCQNQAFQYKDNVLAFQCHVEMTQEMVDQWSELYEDELSQPSSTIHRREQMLADSTLHIPRLNQLASEIYRYWIEQLVRP
jgi:GMP synthase-like glutamine amidotransferase